MVTYIKSYKNSQETIIIGKNGYVSELCNVIFDSDKTLEKSLEIGSNPNWYLTVFFLRNEGYNMTVTVDDQVYAFPYGTDSHQFEISGTKQSVVVTYEDTEDYYVGLTVDSYNKCGYNSVSGVVSNDIRYNDASITIKYDYARCLTGDTLVLMGNYTEKRIDEVHVGDKVISINPNTLEKEIDEVIYSDYDMDKKHNQYDEWVFSDGYIVKTVHAHRFYNVEDKRFKYMDEWKIGEHSYSKEGKYIELLSHKIVNEDVNHYKITTKNNHNYFANGILTGSRLTKNMTL